MKNLLENKIKKVCLVIPSLRHGGAERVISVLANEWSSYYDVEVTLLLLTKQKKYYQIDRKVSIIEPKRGYKSTLISKLFYRIWTLFYIRKEIKKLNPETVLSFCEVYNNLVLLSLVGVRNKKYVSDRSNPSKNLGFVHENLRRLLYKRADGIIAQTERGKAILKVKTNNRNIINIPNPLRIISRENILKENIILNVGRNEPTKNQLELLEIFNKINISSWRLMILGNGELRAKLEEKIQELRIRDNVELLDFQTNIDHYYSKAKVFAFTSLFEGFPNALNEAMAHGLACISYDCPIGPSELITNNVSGKLIPLRDSEMFYQELKNILIDEDLQKKLGENAQYVNFEFSKEKISLQYFNFITQ